MLELHNPVQDVQTYVADMFRKEDWFAAHRVNIVEQNSQALAFLLKTKLDELKGVSLIVGVDGIDNNQPSNEVQITITATERVTLNRAKQGFVTAIDAAIAARQLLDGADFGNVKHAFHFKNLQHTAARDVDILRATATFGVQEFWAQ